MSTVKLVGHTVACLTGALAETDGHCTVTDLIAYCARVSNPTNQSNALTSAKLIKYLVKHKHWSPFEMASATLEITTTRDIARQILRHRSFSFQEFSQRYADPTNDLDFVVREARLQDTTNRQNSIPLTPEQSGLNDWWTQSQESFISKARLLYQEAIQRGIAKEVARAILPEGNTVSRLYMSGTMRSWLHYIELRSGLETQKEHRVIAQGCSAVLEPIFPMILDALKLSL